MATEPTDSLSAEIRKKGLKEGNKILSSSNADQTTAKVLLMNSAGELASAVPVTVVQTDNTGTVFDVTAKGLEGAITGSIVYYGGSTVTQTGAFRVLVTDSTGIGATTGAYYIPFGTLA